MRPYQLPELVATELRRSGTPSVDQLYCSKQPQLGVGQSTDHELEAAVGSAPWRGVIGLISLRLCVFDAVLCREAGFDDVLPTSTARRPCGPVVFS